VKFERESLNYSKAALTGSVRLSIIDGVSDHAGFILLSDSRRAGSLLGTRVHALDQDIKSLSMYKDFVVNIGKLLINEPISESVFPRRWISTA
jgi:hypothetical protein